METAAYLVALVTRGTGAYGYTYIAAPGLARGQLCVVSFRGTLELGVVLHEDSAPPDGGLLSLMPVGVARCPRWGRLLLKLAELSCTGVDEIAGHVLLDTPAKGIKLKLSITDPDILHADARSRMGGLAGWLTPSKRKQLLKACGWEQLCGWHSSGAIDIEVSLAGLPGVTRANPAYRRWFTPDADSAALLGLRQLAGQPLPGHFLAGFKDTIDYTQWEVSQPPTQLPEYPELHGGALSWQPLAWDKRWDIVRQLPGLASVQLRRCQPDWARLRSSGGLAASLGEAVGRGGRILTIMPQAWMLQRLWPVLSPWAARVARCHSSSGPSAAAWLLAQPGQGGFAVLGGPGAWKLAVYGGFDRIVLVDPSHPQYTAERGPGLDVRQGLLAAAAMREGVALDLVELGLSAWDGTSQLGSIRLWEPNQPADDGSAAPMADTDPLPLKLREPGVKRLVYFNRLGASRGLKCMECEAQVACPQCASRQLHYSSQQRRYSCVSCGWHHNSLRCQHCGMMVLAMLAPGLESVVRRPGDLLVHGKAPAKVHPETSSVIGTAHLLEPPAGFWPQQVVYIHAEDQRELLDDWPRAVDMAARLSALYANPQLAGAHLVSERITRQLEKEETEETGPLTEEQSRTLSSADIAEKLDVEFRLRSLASLPPYDCLYYVELLAGSLRHGAKVRELLGKRLHALEDVSLLRLGRPYAARSRWQVAGMFACKDVSYEWLQRLRWDIFREDAFLALRPLRGPWL